MEVEKIKLKFAHAREKLQSLFPDDSRGDVKIVQGKKTYKLLKAFLRLESAYFKRVLGQAVDNIQIKQPFNQYFFANILKCFYGYTIQIGRSQILEYYQIVRFLEIETLLKQLRQDMISKGDSYDIFILMQLAHGFDEQQIFQTCLNQLEKESFEQLRYAKHELLHCSTELFKMIIKTHNRHKAEKGSGISFTQIDQIIKQFSQQRKLNDEQHQDLKFELIDKKSLSSVEYKEIFLEDARLRKRNGSIGSQFRSMIKIGQQPGLYNSSFSPSILATSKLTQSVIEPVSRKLNDELTLEMENTFEKKKNQQLQAQNKYLHNQLMILKQSSQQNKKNYDQVKQIVTKLQKRLEQKEKAEKELIRTIKKLEKDCLQLKNDATEKASQIKKMEEKILKLQKQPAKVTPGAKYINYDDEGEESRTIQSQIVPGHLLKQIAKPAAQALSPPANVFKKAKAVSQAQPVPTVETLKSTELDEIQLEELYSSRLQFDKQPRGCPKKYLPKLANFITTDGFQKKKLTLLYRRNINNQQEFGKPQDLRNKSSLMVLITTKMGQIIGGFQSVEISKNDHDYIKDENAFIFTLSKDEKFNIKKSSLNEALFMAQDYLICFSNDLMISVDCIKSQSESNWPCAYDQGKEKRSSKWLTGEEGSFSIKQIEVYEVQEEEMVMDL